MHEDFENGRSGASYYKSLRSLVPWWRVERPVDWAAVFGRTAPLEVEIGFGNGEDVLRRAKERPDLNLIGIEVAWASTKRALRRLAKEGIENVRLLQIDALPAFERLFSPRSLDRVYSLFPIPWPKERHEKRRIFNRRFLRLAGSRLIDHGQFLVVTDFEPLADWIVDQSVDTGLSAVKRTTSALFDTKYGRKWTGIGQETFHEIEMEKIRHFPEPVTEDTELFTARLSAFDPENFRPVGEEGPITVKFQEFLYDPKLRKGLLRAMVMEENLMQDVFVQIEERGGYWHVGLAQIAQIVPTLGIRRALELARDAAGPAA
jgi:tRNA (guanine-N7-)-methyltransferase